MWGNWYMGGADGAFAWRMRSGFVNRRRVRRCAIRGDSHVASGLRERKAG